MFKVTGFYGKQSMTHRADTYAEACGLYYMLLDQGCTFVSLGDLREGKA